MRIKYIDDMIRYVICHYLTPAVVKVVKVCLRFGREIRSIGKEDLNFGGYRPLSLIFVDLNKLQEGALTGYIGHGQRLH